MYLFVCGSNPDSFPYSLVELEKWQMLFPGHVPIFEDIPFYRDQIHQSTMFLDNWAMTTKPTSCMNHKIMLDQWHGILKIIACDIVTIGLPKKSGFACITEPPQSTYFRKYR